MKATFDLAANRRQRPDGHTGGATRANRAPADKNAHDGQQPDATAAGSMTETLALHEARKRYVPRGVFTYHPVYPASGSGATITDIEGTTFLDFAGGIGTMNVGHSHPEVIAAAHAQLDRFTHTCAHVLTPPLYIELAQRLTELTPGDFEKKALLVNSGAEAVENSIKIARAATGRPAVIAFENSFHGRTNLALALTGKVRPYRAGFGPFTPDIHLAPYADPYHSGAGDRSGAEALAAIERFFATHVPADQVAAIIVEPVQGEGGFIVPPPDFLPGLREICTRHGIVLIIDEIQTGFGRTGRMFAIEHSGVIPDLLLMAKSLAGGLPLAAVVGRAELMDAPLPGGLGGTYGGNPVACAAALAVIEVFEREQLVERAQRLGAMAMERMRDWRRRYELIGDVRGLGAMVAMELVRDRERRTPAAAEAAALMAEARARGLLVIKAGLNDNVIRLLMPLVTTDDEMTRGLDILEESLTAVSALTPAQLEAAH
ncbi:MAG TPA: 4-aminobutyrate--2-oxoglutarate transaminase [Ktedonobacterales bacterium]